MTPRLSVIIPALLHPERVQTCLQSLRLQTLKSGEFEVLVITTEPSFFSAYKTDLPLRCLAISEINVSVARNLGAQQARGHLLLFLDDDTWVEKKTLLYDLLNLFSDDWGTTDLIGGFYRTPPNSSLLALATNTISNWWVDAGHGRHLLGGVFAAKKSVFKTIQFPKEISWGGEDSIFSDRARKAGFVLEVNPDLWVYHSSQGGLKKFLRRSWLSGQVSANMRLGGSRASLRKFGLLKASLRSTSPAELSFLVLHFSIFYGAKNLYKLRRLFPKDNSPQWLPKKQAMAQVVQNPDPFQQ